MEIDQLLRLDIAVATKYDLSRSVAQNYVKENKVLVNNKIISKPSYKVSEDDNIDVKIDDMTFVGRGGQKLLKAIENFEIDVKDKVCLDIGSSTGGFTDCLLQHNARKIFAVDVGTMQLDESLRDNEKISLFENTNIKDLKFEDLGEKADLVVIDISFVSILKIIDDIKKFLKDDSFVVALIKPQFEVGKSNVKKGIVRDIKVHKKTLISLINAFKENGFYINNLTFSPIKGQKGNIEYLIGLTLDIEKRSFDIFADEIVEEAFAKLN